MESCLTYMLLFIILGFLYNQYRLQKRKNLEIIKYEELIKSNTKYILYLRAFEDDGGARSLPIHPYIVSFNSVSSFEEEISKRLGSKNLIAVGKPNEELPAIGAKRLYISNETWKEKLEILIEDATFIIVKPSFTDGLSWELNLIHEKNYFNKVIFFHQFKNKTDSTSQKFYYNTFKTQLQERYSLEMQPYTSKARFSFFNADLSHVQATTIGQTPLLKET